MMETCRKLKVDLRCHTKTHKTLEAADILTGGTRRKIACSTIPECRLYADNDYEDILLAFPISADKIPRCAELANRLDEFHVMLSGLEGFPCLKDGASDLNAGKVWSVFVEIDCGYGRTGIAWDSDDTLEAGTLLKENPNTKLQGLYTHCGQSYDHMTPKQRKDHQKKIVSRLEGVAKKLRALGIEVPVVGTGSTPTCNMAEPVLSSFDEFHPGNYVFNDVEQLYLGSCKLEDIACCVATRVVCQRRDLNMLVVDCGFMGMSHDGMRQRPDDFCVIKDHPHLMYYDNSQELGKVKAKEGEKLDFERYPVGTILFIYPFHSCATAALYQEYLVHSGEKITATWKPVKGW
ncbi:hypothetical protein V1264_011375 [Littorina saxatilis]